jgi:hypothetical protein
MGTLLAGENYILTLLIKNKRYQIGNSKIILNSLGRVYVFLAISFSVYFFIEEMFP